MNRLILTCLLCIVICSVAASRGTEDTHASGLTAVTGGPSSGEGLLPEGDDHETDEYPSGGDGEHVTLRNAAKNDKREKKGRGKKRNRHRGKSTTPLNPWHSNTTRVHTPPHSTSENPCTSTHQGLCIHGSCTLMDPQLGPVCVCADGYSGERCAIQTLGTFTPTDQNYSSELVQTVLVVIAVILSVISCCAILLMTCAHYRSHKNFLASYFGAASEDSKPQKPASDVV